MSAPASPLTLAQWRRTVAALYADVRARSDRDPAAAALHFRAERDRLFADHPDTPLSPKARARWKGGRWYPYDAAWRTTGSVMADRGEASFEIALGADGVVRCTRIATVVFAVKGHDAALPLYWFEGYGGGLWLPFADATSGSTTYGGGRYLYDTIKGADLGADPQRVVLDFNFAYNPSCAYDERWSCPLPPPESRLAFAVEAGELRPDL